MPSQAAIASVYSRVDRLILHTAYEFWKQYGGDLVELQAEARLIFMQAYYSYDGRKKFHYWIRERVWFDLLNQKRTDARRAAMLQRSAYDMMTLIEESHFDLVEFVNDLSNDAATIVRLVFDPPGSMKQQIEENGGRPQEVRAALRRWLLSVGWTVDRITESFEEIREALTP